MKKIGIIMKLHAYRTKKEFLKKRTKKICRLKRVHLKKNNPRQIKKKRDSLAKATVPTVTIYKSELQCMADLSNSWDELETGGELYGSFSRHGGLIIQFATSPGGEAIHKNAMFQQDPVFFQRASLLLFKHFSLQYLGNHHSHNYLPIKFLSVRDIHSINQIALKNDFNQLTQFLVTFENQCSVKCADDYKRVTKIKAFIYADAIHGQPVECKIKVLPGVSPIRQAIESNSDLKSDLIMQCNKTKDFVLYDEYKGTSRKKIKTIPQAVRAQIEQFLGQNNLSGSCIIKGNSVVLQITLFNGFGFLFIVYDILVPYDIRAVFYKIDKISKSPVDISDEILVNDQALESLDVIYSLCKRLVIKHFTRSFNYRRPCERFRK